MEVLTRVGMPTDTATRYPAQFSDCPHGLTRVFPSRQQGSLVPTDFGCRVALATMSLIPFSSQLIADIEDALAEIAVELSNRYMFMEIVDPAAELVVEG